MIDLALATSEALPELLPGDRRLQEALRDRGLNAHPLVWTSRPEASPSHLVLRSCWDYHHRHGEFFAWLDRLQEAGTQIANPVELMRWNSSKIYLRALRDRGVPMPETIWAESVEDLRAGELRSGAVVVKPWISASAHRTRRSNWPFDAAAHAEFARDLEVGPMLVQEFLPEIESEGEISFLFFGGEFHHAVRKVPAHGDFRVQEVHGGSVHRVKPEPGAIDRAHEALAAAGSRTAYARVDAVVIGSSWKLLELELIEPELFLEREEGAADVLADALLSYFDLS